MRVIHHLAEKPFEGLDQRFNESEGSNLIDHATSEVHKVAMGQMCVEHAKVRGESPTMLSTLGCYFLTLDEGTWGPIEAKV